MDHQPSNLEAGRLRPWPGNPRYWQHRGRPVLLAGASDTHNLFQWEPTRLRPHLDLLVESGGNLVRNTMSDREPGNLRAFREVAPGTYDLTVWNEAYWERFAGFLEDTARRGVFVQIELWDRFDVSREPWRTSPWNPRNNVTYTAAETGLAAEYPEHPGRNLQPFFYSVPALRPNPPLLARQEAFIRRVLDVSLPHGHVLYCADNETSGDPAWARHWRNFTHAAAAARGRGVEFTEMWDAWHVADPQHRATLDHPELYSFVDASQNSHLPGERNWTNAQWLWARLYDRPPPLNSTKVYGADTVADKWPGEDTAHGVDTFWRNLVGGFASTRFHRPPHGIGLSPLAAAQLRAVRGWLERYDLFAGEPDSTFRLFARRGPNQAYANVVADRAWTLFFPAGGEVELRLRAGPEVAMAWCDLADASWQPEVRLAEASPGVHRLATPAAGRWLAVLRAL